MTQLELRKKLSGVQHNSLQLDIKLSKALIIIDGLIIALNEAVSVIAKHEHNDQALNSIKNYLEAVIDSTNEKLGEL